MTIFTYNLATYVSTGDVAGLVVPPNQKSWIHPWAHPPSENPGYVHAPSTTPALCVWVL